MENLKKVANQQNEETLSNDSRTTRGAWVKPTLKRLALKEALNGPSGTNDAVGMGARS